MEISADKSFLHVPYCESNHTLCSICQKNVINEEFEEHSINHSKQTKKCNYCSLNVSVDVFDSHIIICSPFSNCQYCTLQLLNDELLDHEKICGSMTTACDYCGEVVLIKNLNNHSKFSCFPEANYKDSFRIESLVSDRKKSKISNMNNSKKEEINYYNNENEIIYKFDNTYNETLITLYNQISITSNLNRNNKKNKQSTKNEVIELNSESKNSSYIVDEMRFNNENLNINLNIPSTEKESNKFKHKKKGKVKQPKYLKSEIRKIDDKYYDYDD